MKISMLPVELKTAATVTIHLGHVTLPGTWFTRTMPQCEPLKLQHAT